MFCVLFQASVGQFLSVGSEATFVQYSKLYHVVMYGCSPKLSGSFATYCASDIPDPWEVGAEFTCSPTYIITQEDIDAGTIANIVR